jgi:fibronectin type 3 domain-containing protein
MSTRPTGPRQLTSSFGDSYIDLVWKEPRDLGGPAKVRYNIYKGPTPLGVRYYKTVNETAFNDTDVVNGEIYYYMVSAFNDLGEGGFSEKVTETPGTSPGMPLDLVAVPGNRNVSITWSPPEDDGGYIIYRYNLFRGTDPDEMELLNWVNYDIKYLDKKVENGVTYYYQVLAVNTLGKGPITSLVSAMPASVPSKPRSFLAIAGNSVVDLSWAPPENNGGLDLLNYRVLRGTEGEGPKPIVELDNVTYIYRDVEVTNGVSYYYMVRAVNDLGPGTFSSNISVTPATLPDVPRDLTAEGEDNYVVISWRPPLNDGGYEITSYKIFRGYEPDDLIYLDTVTGNTTYTDPELKNGVTFYYQVLAVTKYGESPKSEVASAKPGSVPRKPYGFNAGLDGKEVSLTWFEPVFDGGYPIIGYYVYKGETIEGMEILTMVLAVNYTRRILNFTDLSIEKDKIYYYQVTAFNVHGESESTPALLVRTDEAWNSGGSSVQRLLEFWWLFLAIGLTLSALITLTGYMFVRNKERWLVDGKPQFNVIYRDLKEKTKRTEKKDSNEKENQKEGMK